MIDPPLVGNATDGESRQPLTWMPLAGSFLTPVAANATRIAETRV
jgi:hypothetical protein